MWRRTPWGWVAVDRDGVRWTVRGPMFAKPMFWLYRNGSRVTESGRYEDALSFTTLEAAKGYAANVSS